MSIIVLLYYLPQEIENAQTLVYVHEKNSGLSISSVLPDLDADLFLLRFVPVPGQARCGKWNSNSGLISSATRKTLVHLAPYCSQYHSRFFLLRMRAKKKEPTINADTKYGVNSPILIPVLYSNHTSLLSYSNMLCKLREKRGSKYEVSSAQGTP